VNVIPARIPCSLLPHGSFSSNDPIYRHRNMAEYCQNCRQPIDVDPSLALLNPASFDLLVVTTGKSHSNSAATLSRLNYPQERKDLYDQVSAQANSPVYKRFIPAPQDGTRLRKAGHTKGNADMSFIEITQSQVALTDRDHRDQGNRKTVTQLNGNSDGPEAH